VFHLYFWSTDVFDCEVWVDCHWAMFCMIVLYAVLLCCFGKGWLIMNLSKIVSEHSSSLMQFFELEFISVFSYTVCNYKICTSILGVVLLIGD
jgi:hypothetical protein